MTKEFQEYIKSASTEELNEIANFAIEVRNNRYIAEDAAWRTPLERELLDIRDAVVLTKDHPHPSVQRIIERIRYHFSQREYEIHVKMLNPTRSPGIVFTSNDYYCQG
jgi:hypothetical protein